MAPTFSACSQIRLQQQLLARSPNLNIEVTESDPPLLANNAKQKSCQLVFEESFDEYKLNVLWPLRVISGLSPV